MQSGQHVTPTIRLVRPLGQGAMGSVWVADHLATGAQVAVKFMTVPHAGNEQFVARFRQEARAAASLHSPYVARVYDHGVTAEGSPFIVMELLEGETLRQRLKRLGPRPLDEVVLLVDQAAKALGLAHRRGVIHRDIKPDNLFVLDVEGEPFLKVIDFGIAKQVDPVPHLIMACSTATNSLLGSPAYMSPEQITSAKHVDNRADLWSLAVVTYELLTGKRPFAGESLGALIIALDAGSFPPPSTLRRGLSATVDTWMARALHRDLEARFRSAREMAQALQEAASDRAGKSRKMDRSPEVGRPDAADSGPPPIVEPALVAVDKLDELQVKRALIALRDGSIIKAGAEAIVCPTDSKLSPDFDPVCRMIHRAAGPQLAEMTARSAPWPTESAVITGAGQLPPPTRYVIHARGPIYDGRRETECASLLRRAIQSSLWLAEKSGARSVAFPSLSTNDGYPLEKAAAVALEAAAEHLDGALVVEHIIFVLITDVSYEAFAHTLAALARRRAG